MTKKLASTCTSLLTDTRYALRGLRNAPGYAVTVVLTLALGLGAVTTMLRLWIRYCCGQWRCPTRENW